MDYLPAVEFCPARATFDWSQVQCADTSFIQVANYGPVKYFEPPPDTEEEDSSEEDDNGKSCAITLAVCVCVCLCVRICVGEGSADRRPVFLRKWGRRERSRAPSR